MSNYDRSKAIEPRGGRNQYDITSEDLSVLKEQIRKRIEAKTTVSTPQEENISAKLERLIQEKAPDFWERTRSEK